MKHPHLSFRRAGAVAASALLGIIGALALTTPAHAHWSEVAGSPYCDTTTGEWVVTWTVISEWHFDADTWELTDADLQPPGTATAPLPTNVSQPVDQPFTIMQRLPGDATSATLKTLAGWNDGYQEEKFNEKKNSATVTFDGSCEMPDMPEKPEPAPVTATAASTCDALLITLTNPQDGEQVTATLTPSAGDAEDVVVAAGQTTPITFEGADGLTVEVAVSDQSWTFGWEPEDCETEVEVPLASLSDCDSLTIEVTNPLEEGDLTATVTSGDQSETLTIPPGESAEASFDAEEGTTATVTIGDVVSDEIAWAQPKDCVVPTPSTEPPGQGGGLPVTGANTGLIAGLAVGMLALGAGLYLLARRRRTSFDS